MYKDCDYTIILEEHRCGSYFVTCQEIPSIKGEVTGSYQDEVISRAKNYLHHKISEMRTMGLVVPSSRGGGIIIYRDGAKVNAPEHELWSYRDVRRYLGVSMSTIRRRVADCTLQKLTIGSRALFDPAQVKEALLAKK